MMAKKTRIADDRKFLLQMIEESYQLPNWNETSLKAALRRVTPQMAAWRPPHAKRSIADLVLHTAYWKYALRRRLIGDKRGSFPYKGSNWFKTPKKLTPEKWKEYVVLLQEQHAQLCDALGNCPRKLAYAKPQQDGHWTIIQRCFWLAIHDGYHTGQINLIKAMYRRKTAKS